MAFDATADITGAFLSSMVVAIHCRRCKHYAPVAGLMDQPLVLWRHRGHLGEVTADLLICDRDTNRISGYWGHCAFLPVAGYRGKSREMAVIGEALLRR